ncbi:hypothetical protein GE09DRAFT_1281885 [Coniochaeta sp. 2T2.1]|nr:hypothetical protein GE09DRAFT_1281885 [Coniochaeta sp. 2T2.1]
MLGATYKQKPMEEDEGESGERLLETPEPSIPVTKKGLQLHSTITIVSLSFNVFFVFFGLFYSTHKSDATRRASYEYGFDSDLGIARSEIELVVQPFSGGVELDGEGHFSQDPRGQEYVGPPQPCVDDAWEKLLGGLNLDFDKTEIDLGESTFQWPDTGFYFSGLDVYHSLHCLNRLRQAMYPDYYTHIFDRPGSPNRADHIDHCINHIRQSLQCHADLTPMEWRLSGSNIIIKTDTHHTCRNFDKIHRWASSHRTQFSSIPGFMNGSLRIVD